MDYQKVAEEWINEHIMDYVTFSVRQGDVVGVSLAPGWEEGLKAHLWDVAMNEEKQCEKV